MSYKTIAVFFNRKDNAEGVARYACSVARKFNSHLIGIFVTDSMENHPGLSPYIGKTILDQFEQSQTERMEDVKSIFQNATKNEDFVSEWRTSQGRGNIGSTVCQMVRCSDLIIMPQMDPDSDRASYKDSLETVIRQSGRPVLVVPFAGHFDTVGEHPLVGWSPTREATRAIHDALPFIESSKDTLIMSVGEAYGASNGSSPTSELAAVLNRHGAKVTVAHRPKGTISIGDQLLNEAFEHGSDLIVTGAYGHSAIYDFVIGATTTHILDHMTAPVLLSN